MNDMLDTLRMMACGCRAATKEGDNFMCQCMERPDDQRCPCGLCLPARVTRMEDLWLTWMRMCAKDAEVQ